MTNSERRPGNKIHLDKLIAGWAQTTDLGAGQARRLISFAVMAQLLSELTQEGTPIVAIKGGASLLMRFGPAARTTRDFDTVTTLDLDKAFERITDHLEQGWEGFTGKVTRRGEISRAATQPIPQRCKIKLAYKNKPFSTIDFEIGHESDQALDNIDQIRTRIDLSPVLLASDHDVPLLNVHYQIAQKLHACTEPFPDSINQRVHDLYDITLLRPLAEKSDLNHTAQACIKTFTRRNKHPWPPSIPDHPQWRQLWDQLQLTPELFITYDEARQSTIDLTKSLTNQ